MEEMIDVLNELGEYTGEIVSRKSAHTKGLWHKAVVLFIMNESGEILIQQRSANKKLWPNKWDITAGGHVLHHEFGYQAVIREAKEEIGVFITPKDLLFIGGTLSKNMDGDIINCHFNEFYIVKKEVNIKDIVLQEEEIQNIKWISKDKLIEMILNRSEELTDKWNCWDYLNRYLTLVER